MTNEARMFEAQHPCGLRHSFDIGHSCFVIIKPRLQFCVLTYETFCGGIFETNCYLVEAPEVWILFDAPDGACDWLDSRQLDLKLLLLTHGHIDHVQDVAKIKRRFNCPIGCHPITAPMISDREFFRR